MKFFKKTAVVLVLALLVTLIPAKETHAAKTSSLAFQNAKSSAECIKSFELKVGEEQDLKFYGVSDYRTTGIGFESSNESVATVDKMGVVKAKGVGSAQIVYRASGYVSIPTTVVVFADSYNVYLADQDTGTRYASYSMKVGDSHDFKFVGATGWSSKIYSATWASSDEDIATVDTMGLVTAHKVGSCQIVLTIIRKDNQKVAFNVRPLTINVKEGVNTTSTPTPAHTRVPGTTATPTPSATPSASPSPAPTQSSDFSIKQTEYDKALVTFSNKNIKDNEINLSCPTVRIDKVSSVVDGVVTVTFGEDLIDGHTYTISNGSKSATFKASNGTPASLGFKYSCCGQDNVAYANEIVYLYPIVYDKNGIVINWSAQLFSVQDGYEYEIYDGMRDIVADVAGTKYTYKIKSYTDAGKELVYSTVITVTNKPAYTATAQVKIVSDNAAFEKGSDTLSVCMGDENKALVFKYTDNRGNKGVESSVNSQMQNDSGFFFFESSNDGILFVDENGLMYPIKTGVVAVRLKFTDIEGTNNRTITVGTYTVQVKDARAISNATITYDSIQNMTLSVEPGADHYNEMTLSFSFKDQYNETIDPSLVRLESFKVRVNGGEAAGSPIACEPSVNSVKGTYDLKLTVDYDPNPSTLSTKCTVYFESAWSYNGEYNNYKLYTSNSRAVQVVNTTKGNPTPSYVPVFSATSPQSLGISEGTGALKVEAFVVESKNGGYATKQPIAGEYRVNATYTEADLGKIYYTVSVNGSGSSKDFVGATANKPSVVNDTLNIPVRAALTTGSTNAEKEAGADTLANVGSVTIKVTFYRVRQSGTRYVANSVGAVTRTLRNSDPTSSVVVSIPESNLYADYRSSIASNNDWIEWLETHGTTTITNGITGETITVNELGGFARNGIVVEAYPISRKTTGSSTTDPWSSNYLRSVDFYVPVGNGGYIKITALVNKNVSIRNR